MLQEQVPQKLIAAKYNTENVNRDKFITAYTAKQDNNCLNNVSTSNYSNSHKQPFMNNYWWGRSVNLLREIAKFEFYGWPLREFKKN